MDSSSSPSVADSDGDEAGGDGENHPDKTAHNRAQTDEWKGDSPKTDVNDSISYRTPGLVFS